MGATLFGSEGWGESSSLLALRPYQEAAIDAVKASWARGVLRPAVVMATGCHRAGQGVMMFDGTVKSVETVNVGDLLMGPDSTPRVVRQLARGTGPMMEVRPVKGEPWVVNDEHILTLVETNKRADSPYPSERGGTIRDVAVSNWHEWSKTRKHMHKLFRVPVDFPAREAPPIDSYFLGVVLGDGSLSVPGRLSIATADPEIADLCHEVAKGYGLAVRIDGRKGIQHHISGGQAGKRRGRAGGTNPIVNTLRDLGVLPITCAERFVPDCYKLGSRDVRLAVFAGLIDSDGAIHNAGFDYGAKSERLAADVAFIARSLGLAAYMAKRPNGHYRVLISGDCSIVPTRLPRKQPAVREQKKDHLRTGFDLVPTGTVEPYYGFALSGDQRYLLDDFTVTHNSGKTVVFSHMAASEPGRTLILAHRQELVAQAAGKLLDVAPHMHVGVEMADSRAHDAHVVVASVQTMASQRRREMWARNAFSQVIVDECHHGTATTYREILDYFGSFDRTRTLGVTATLARGDGAGLGEVWQEVAYERGIKEMIADGYLVEPHGKVVPLEGIDFSKVTTSHGDYTANSLGEQLTEAGMAEHVAAAYVTHAKDRRGIVFTPTVQTAQDAAAALKAAGVKAEAVWGEMADDHRKRVIAQFRTGEVQVLTNCMVLVEGFDAPEASCVVMARPTKSAPLYIQVVGRVLRPAPWAGKRDALVIDIVGASKQHKIRTLKDLSLRPGKKFGNGERVEGEGSGEVEDVETLRHGHVEEVSLFEESNRVWLRTRDGHWFIPAGGGFVFLRPWPNGAGYSVGWFGRYDDQPTLVQKITDLGYAMARGEASATEYERLAGQYRTSVRDARWRNELDPSERQLTTAAKMRIKVPRHATAGQVSDLITLKLATGKIDGYFRNRAA
ncbi:DEAD/DEAH box helicase family protein [Frankia sp. AgW1.1]|uniref:DEAD/DEAH box helicase family protein n=1 Tax=Frankia sp. AgW1.1 TaxID=1836971 RepID=UPI00193406F3|nr:DEAD/DEAH box helicase family protein [Frankia sp. AgW1.1]MBL7487026.1 DEAD/DEAH box helicase family protein [Frankia sp. AgW1.1]